ncbi:hypothetical protein BTN50_1649 (plasmid) [Candidatus Enterovibrio altilux]|uniref:Mobile element protein n=1 Tax=Candidatus Enterovibrio altilux TaxID=1927128 RepID=A0A291BAT8_9GAMM|nr:hypothetical protein BTN50_1649 [Candidatus Enterovibrio luxaltus]
MLYAFFILRPERDVNRFGSFANAYIMRVLQWWSGKFENITHEFLQTSQWH